MRYGRRYFLRRLAAERRDPKNLVDWVSFGSALLETTLIYIGSPIVAALSTFVLLGMRYYPEFLRHSLGASPFLPVLGMVAASSVAGYCWFRYAFKEYRQNHAACLKFDSERDRRIIAMQKFVTLAICFFVIPMLCLIAVAV